MRHLISLIILLLIPAVSSADESSFKVNASTQQWKKDDTKKFDGVMFVNSTKSVKQYIVLRDFEISKPEQTAFLKANLHDVSEIRSKFMAKFGVGGYSILDMQTQPVNLRGFKSVDVIAARFFGIDGKESQSIERQYVRGKRMYTVTYIVHGAAMNDRKRIEATMDAFVPNVNDRMPAAEVAGGGGAVTAEKTDCGPACMNVAAVPEKLQLPPPAPAGDTLCADVPKEKRRTDSSQNYVESNFLLSGAYCAKGVGLTAWKSITDLWDMGVAAKNYATDSRYRDQVNASAGTLYAEVKKAPLDFSKRILSAVYEAGATYSAKFAQCMNPKAQAEALCGMLTYLIPAGLLVKIVSRAKLTAQETAAIAKAAELAMKGNKAENSAEALRAMKLAEMKLVETPPPGMTLDSRGIWKKNGKLETDINLITPAQYDSLPDGTVLRDFNGGKYVKGVDYIDQDTRGGFTAFGFPTESASKISPASTGTAAAAAANVKLIEGPPAGMKLHPYGVLEKGSPMGLKDAELHLVTPDQLKKLPKGTVLTTINGRQVVAGVDNIDGDTRGGFLAVGFKRAPGTGADVKLIEGPPAGMKLNPNGVLEKGSPMGLKDADLQLVTPDQLKKLPDGTVLTSINGRKVIVGVDNIDDDVRGGFTAFGFKREPGQAGGAVTPSAQTAGVAEKISYNQAAAAVDENLAALSSGGPGQREAIQRLGNTVLPDSKAAEGRALGAVNERGMKVVDDLQNVIYTSKDPAVQMEAVQALGNYARNNSDNYTRGFIGRRAPESLQDIVANYNLPDDVRKVALQQLNIAEKSSGFKPTSFVPSAQLRKADTIEFLGKTKKELTYPQQSAAHKVQQYFGGESTGTKRQIYESLASDRGLPKEYVTKWVDKVDFVNSNYLGDLSDVGFKMEYVGDKKVFRNAATGGMITIPSPPAGSMLRPFTDVEKLGFRRVILNGGAYTIDTPLSGR